MSLWGNPGLREGLDGRPPSPEGPARACSTPASCSVLRINAGGRIGRSDLGARLLSTDDPDEAQALAEELDALNLSRREVEREVAERAAESIERRWTAPGEQPAIVVSGEGWHPGVIGIVAGRLRERYRRPVVVIGVDPVLGLGKGSGRSQPGVNLGRAVQAAFEQGLLLAGGGHALAAGLTVKADRIEAFEAFLTESLAAESHAAAEADAVEIDALVTPASADRALFEAFQQLSPVGPGNPEPMFALANVAVEQPRALNGGHVRCLLSNGAGARLKAVAWRAGEASSGRRLLQGGAGLHVAGRLKADDWNGRRSVELEIEDVADLAPQYLTKSSVGRACTGVGRRIYAPFLATVVPSSIG